MCAEVKTLRIVNDLTINITTVITDPVDIIIYLIVSVELVIRFGRFVVLFFETKLIIYKCK